MLNWNGIVPPTTNSIIVQSKSLILSVTPDQPLSMLTLAQQKLDYWVPNAIRAQVTNKRAGCLDHLQILMSNR